MGCEFYSLHTLLLWHVNPEVLKHIANENNQ